MKLLAIVVAFFIGILFCASYSHKDLMEGFETDDIDCPDLLVQEGKRLMLLNTKKARIPGRNPIYFDNLEDYVEFVKWQRSQGVRCPILYFQGTYDSQGKKGYRMLNDPLDPQAGMPSNHTATEVPLYDAGRDDPPYNRDSFPGYDPTNQNLGRYTPLDKMFNDRGRKSADAMDVNWAGAEYTRRMIKKGVYDQNHRPFSKFKGVVIPKEEMQKEFNRQRQRIVSGQTQPPAKAGATMQTSKQK